MVLLPAAGFAQQLTTLEIGVLADQVDETTKELLDELLGEIRAVVGLDAKVELRAENLKETGFDPARAEELYEALLGGTPDVVLAFGLASALALDSRAEYPKPTILFGSINRDLVSVGKGTETSGVANFTYVVTSRSASQDLERFRDLYPFESLGFVMAADRARYEPAAEGLREKLAKLGSSLTLIPYRSLEDLEEQLEGVDAVYLADSWGLSEGEIRALADLLVTKRIPSFSGVRRQDVEMGFMATTHPEENLTRLFRRIALHIAALVEGEPLSERSVFVDLAEALTVNVNTAQLVGVPLRHSLIATTELVGDFVSSLSEETYELADLVAASLARNLDLRARGQDVELASQGVKEAAAAYLPSLSAEASATALDPDVAELAGGQNPEYSTSSSLVLDQLVFSPAASATRKIQNELLGAEQEQLRGARLDLILEASSTYFETLVAKANVRIRSDNLEVTKRSLRAAELNLAAGQGRRSDVLRLKSQAARDLQSLLESVTSLDRAYRAVNQLLSNPIDRKIELGEAVVDRLAQEDAGMARLRAMLDDPLRRAAFEDFLVSKAFEHSPELRALEASLAATELTIALNGKQRFRPTLTARLQYDWTLDQWGAGAPDPSIPSVDHNYSGGLSLSVPLFDSNRHNIDRRTAMLERDQLRWQHESTAIDLEARVRDAVSELMDELSDIQLSKVSEEASAEMLDITREAYRAGAIRVVELLDAQADLLQAQLARSNAEYGFLASGMSLGRLLGHFFLLETEAANQAFFGNFIGSSVSRGGNDQ